jgi:5-oxoprolinase (ATP-hydrolysing) subunit C
MTFARRALRATKVLGLVTVQDAGRRGFMHLGVPPGGALVPDALARANVAVGNDPGAPALEIVGRVGVTSEDGLDRRAVVVGIDDGARHELSPGEAFELASSDAARVRYLAVAGGIDVPIVLGGRGTLLVARMGGLDGRVLRVGDVLPAGDAEPRAISSTERAATPAPIALPPPASASADIVLRVLAGPDHDAAALDSLVAATFRIGAATDRVGARLVGHHMQTALTVARSRPMVRGAIQIPPSGEPIVLGPDHPTTGGYPVIAVVITSDVGAIYTRSAGASVAFALAGRS